MAVKTELMKSTKGALIHRVYLDVFALRGINNMAIYYLSVSLIKRSAGRSSTAAAAYRSGSRIEDERTGLIHDYSRKHGVDDAHILAPTDAPEWVYSRCELWNRVERAEKRKDAQLAREIDVAIPVELTQPQMKRLVSEFIQDSFVSEGMVADVCYRHLDGANPHAHIMLTMRDISSSGFGGKNRSWNDKGKLEGWREAWTRHSNEALEDGGSEERIDHRSLVAQGINRPATEHRGPTATAMLRVGKVPERGGVVRC